MRDRDAPDHDDSDLPDAAAGGAPGVTGPAGIDPDVGIDPQPAVFAPVGGDAPDARDAGPVGGGGARRRMLRRRRRTLAAAATVVLVVGLGVAAVRALGGGSEGAAPVHTPLAATGSPTSAASPGAAPSEPGSATPSSAPDASATAGDSSHWADPSVDPAMPTTLPAAGTGATSVLALPGADSTRSGRTVRYTVEVEGGLGLPTDAISARVREVLTDERGWEPRDGVHFVNVTPAARADGADADVRIILATPAYVDRNCLPLQTMGSLSCHARGKVLLNAKRWAYGADTYADLSAYRTYLVNHEVGHALGHSHRSCPGAGRPAPVMVQQTKSLFGCAPWPWPRPPGTS